jgi:nucleoid-associated protein YgaU
MFARGSRYGTVPDAVHVDASGREVPYKLLRLLPAPPPTVQTHLVADGDRLDLLAHRYLGDPELFWRICDANGALRPEELTREPGRVLGIPIGVP